ncbi:glutamine synthetase family protein [Zavarzinia compransoris]|uniref:Glutamine synthetase n=1 Tax=Zavarzinia compransoris TaxID=1264899 RepID=A0A317E4J1_9PROT|nr:glutamine synthetase family protein [Zavarzinia compransoris]PWR21076.1 glutamine synthetase [Zavarzinia compransoris]TDP44396.1 L-glutamine synthetase [Zavarzinia compransoris]
MSQLDVWLRERHITEVECLVPDISGVARGKILPTSKFLKSQTDNSLRLPESIFSQTVTGEFVDSEVTDPTEPDVVLKPDPDTLSIVPWYDDPTAQVINDCVYRDGRPVPIAPRQVLRRVIDLYAAKGWKAIVAPELEFYLCAKNVDPDYPLQPPIGRSGRAETGSQSYGIDAVNEFDPIFEDVYQFCEAQELDVDTLIHEAGRAQCEINFNHADPMSMADQAFMFKRTVRQAAMRHGVYATFMAKPYSDEPGSAMHLHQSVVDIKTGRNLFSDDEGNDTALFRAHIAGLQKHLPAAMPLIAPNVNSYRRLTRFMSAPINLHWARENRTAGLRVPESGPEARRVENRVPGADANPYLVIAASLACGYIGMVNELEPTDPIVGSAYSRKFALPRYLPDALNKLKGAGDLSEVLGEEFVTLLMEVKQAEHDAYQQVISAWEREHLLLNV